MHYASFLPVTKPITVDYINKKVYIDSEESHECGKLALFFSNLFRYVAFMLVIMGVYLCILIIAALIAEILEMLSTESIKSTHIPIIAAFVTIIFGAIELHPTTKYVENIGTNIYVIPRFKNYSLEYELLGDYSKLISKIDITENLHKRAKFTATFYFKDIPISGMMKLKYL